MSPHRDTSRTLTDVALLFELSLAVGTSLDLEENCRRFLTTLMARKNLDFAAVWLREDGLTPSPETAEALDLDTLVYRVVYATPDAHVGLREMSSDHALLRRLEEGRGFSLPGDAGPVASFMRERVAGRTAVFPLAPRGFLVLHSSLPDGLASDRELRQLEAVIDKLAISVEGCVAHDKVLREVSERKRAEADRALAQEQLHHAQKMDAVGRLAGGVAHDFNNALTGILGCAELLQREVDEDTRAQLLGVIQGAAQNAADLTGQLLAFSRRGQYVSRRLVLDELLAQVVALLRRTVDPRIALESRLNLGGQHAVLGDSSQLQSAFLNLGVNARDAIATRGTIRISTERHDLEEPVVDRHGAELAPGRYARVRVEDDGSGMSADTLERIFEPFFSTKAVGHGTGLGLAAVYGTVSGHGGSIDVRSTPGVGTTFEVLLPLAPSESRQSRPSDPELPRLRGTLLLVDDDARVRKVCRRMCERLGYVVVVAEGGHEAVEHLASAAEPAPDLVLLDVRMAGLSGPETLERIRLTHPDLPVVVVSGFVSEYEMSRVYELGIQGLLHKPFTLAELGARLRKAGRRPE